MTIREVWNAVAKNLVNMLAVKSHRPGTLFAFVSVLAMTASMLVSTNIASADQVQVQSYQRTSQTAACAAQPGETPWQASWGPDSSWKPSWEQWANNGTGGWVCTRSITWARTGSSARTYALGDIGPGGGLVFLISGGLTYEMAPKAWSGALTPDSAEAWCSDTSSSIAGAVSTAIGTGSANTTAMQSPACTSGAGVSARAYRGGGLTDWFLPSKDELNAMCNYWINPTTPPTGACTGAVSTGDYGFTSAIYWSSSQPIATVAWAQKLITGELYNPFKSDAVNQRVRPVRAF
jgi:hypothetical protein